MTETEFNFALAKAITAFTKRVNNCDYKIKRYNVEINTKSHNGRLQLSVENGLFTQSLTVLDDKIISSGFSDNREKQPFSELTDVVLHHLND